MVLGVAHPLASWDALVLNVAAAGRARPRLTEDLKPGCSRCGVRVATPLVEPLDPLLLQVVA
jgi:predicted nucleic acid-binding protein